MGKLFGLKNWLTISEAARHLSTKFEEPVSEADVLRLGLDDRLLLSVYFVNNEAARRGNLVSSWKTSFNIKVDPLSDTELLAMKKFVDDSEPQVDGPKVLFRRTLRFPPPPGYFHQRGSDLKADKLIPFNSEIELLSGVFDLPMYGNGLAAIERAYQKLVGWPDADIRDLGGVIVRGFDNNLYQLQERCDESQGEKRYRPAFSLPTDAAIVVRTEVLKEFVQSVINGADNGKDDSDAIPGIGQADSTLQAMNEARKNDSRYAVALKALNLRDWPLITGDDQTLHNAINRNAPWVSSAIKSTNPKLVYPAMLAILLQQHNKKSDVYANPEALRKYLGKNFPDCLDEYETHIDYGKDDVT